MTGDEQEADLGENRIASTAVADMRQLALGLLVSTLASLPIAIFLPEELEGGSDLALVGLVFPATALGFAAALARRRLAWRRFGRLALVMDPFPGALGGDVGGQVDVRLRYGPGRDFRVALACLHIEERHDSADRETVLWDRDGLPEAAPAAGGTRLRFRFTVPDTLPESGDGCHWRLRLSAPGTGFDRTFALPVQAGGDAATHARIAESHEALIAAGGRSPLPRGISLEGAGSAITLRLAPARNLGATVSLLLLSAILLGPAAGLAYFASDLFGGGLFATLLALVPSAMAVVFGLLGLLLLLAGLGDLGRSRYVQADRDGIAVSSRLFGLPAGREHMAATALDGFETEVGTRVGNRPGSTKIQRLVARDASGGRLVVDPALLRRLEEDLRSATGLPAPPTP
jgi:hypothetical protein